MLVESQSTFHLPFEIVILHSEPRYNAFAEEKSFFINHIYVNIKIIEVSDVIWFPNFVSQTKYLMKTNQTYINRLNDLLSSYQIHYQNLRSLHWHILGANFFELHAKYEQLYNRVQLIIDELAERILTLGGLPLSKLKDYLKNSSIEENELIRDGESGVNYILSAQKELLIVERELLKLSTELEDQGTNSFLSDLIKEKEKINWMLSAWSVKQTELVF